MTRVALDCRALEHPALAERGIGRYVASLSSALQSADAEIVELREHPGDTYRDARTIRRPRAPERIRELMEHLWLARDVRGADADVLHSPSIDFVSRWPGAPLVVTVHDLAPLKHPDLYLKTGLKHRLRYAVVRRAARVIVPSSSVASDCAELLRIPGERITVIPEAPSRVFHPRPDARQVLARLELPERFLLWVGGLDPPDPRKGVEQLARAVAASAGLPLVLGGRASEEAAVLAVPGRVQLTGRLSDDELAALYTLAEAFVFPSSEEGYGLPPVEALACGTPVAAFRSPGLTETLDGTPGATLVDPGDYEALLTAAERIAGTLAPLPTRTWNDVATETIAVYKQARIPPSP